MRVKFLLVAVIMALAGLAAMVMLAGAPAAAQDMIDHEEPSTSQPNNGDDCLATVDGSATVHTSADSQALRDAVADAVDGDLVKVSGYCAGVATIQAVEATVYVSKSITIMGGYNTVWIHDPVAYTTTLDAERSGRVVVISDIKGVTLDSLHIVGGASPASGRGGGVYVTSDAVATVTHSIVNDCSAYLGGGISVSDDSEAIVSHSTIFSNTAGANGGGFYIRQDATLTVSHSIVYSNTADRGGGIYLSTGGSDVYEATVNVSNSTILGNTAENGGGIYNYDGGLFITNSTLGGNQATLAGGGIHNAEFATAHLTNSTVSGNEAHIGGGIYQLDDASIYLTNCTVSENRTTISAGGIVAYSPVHLKDTIVAGQLSGRDCDVGELTTSQGYNLDSDGTCNLEPAKNDIISGTTGLGPLQVNAPGETATHALGANSQALDGGSCAGGTIDYDQRGVARPQGEACDMGAYEARFGIAVKKSANPTTAWVGQQVAYTYIVTNTSDFALSNIQADDDKLGNVPLAKTALAPGESTLGARSHTVVVEDLPGPLTNTVHVTGTPPLGDNVTATHVISVPAGQVLADLAITKTVEPGEGTLAYTIVVRNLGPEAVAGATVFDSFPALLQNPVWICSATGGATCTAAGSGDIADTLASFPSSSVVTYSVVAGFDTVGQLVNTANVTAPANVIDLNPANNTATAITQSGYRVFLPVVLRDH